MTKIIDPKILKGTRDFLPQEMAKRLYVQNKIKSVFESFGYDTIETPVIEYAETLLGKYGDEGNKLVYRFEDNGRRDIALRYDQTVPTARFVAANWQDLPMPFKRYQISRVWRADKPAKGRYREFYQCDVDIIGTESLIADAEIARVICRVFEELGFKNFRLKFNSRRLIDAILNDLDVDLSLQNKVIALLDKLDKNPKQKVIDELRPFIGKEKSEKLIEIVTFRGSNQDKLNLLNNDAKLEIEKFIDLCKNFGIKEENLDFDLSLARGLAYYTGVVYELVCDDVQIGSLCGGGRYDNLCSMFSKRDFPGVGVALGFDRIVVAMEDLGLLKDLRLNSDVLITFFDEESLAESLKILAELQEAGVNAETYVQADKLAKQFKYADKKSVPFVIVCGSEEIEKEEVTVKIMSTGQQKTIPRSQIVSYLTGFKS